MTENVGKQGEIKRLGRRGGLGELTENEFDKLKEIIDSADSNPMPYPDNTGVEPYVGLFERGYITGKNTGMFKKKTVLVPTEKGTDAYRAQYAKMAVKKALEDKYKF